MSENPAPFLRLTKCRENFTIPQRSKIIINKLPVGYGAHMTSESDSAYVNTYVATLLKFLCGSMIKMSV